MVNRSMKKKRKAGVMNIDTVLWSDVRDLILEARRTVARGVNAALVWTNFEIGCRIIEHEQKGKVRAEYAEETLNSLSQKLTGEFGRGYSVDNLERMRRFYLVYSKSETLSRISPSAFLLSWSHYVFLIGIEDENERRFYEIESANQNWSLRELRRQFNSSLYERLTLSRDKEKVCDLNNNVKLHLNQRPPNSDGYCLNF